MLDRLLDEAARGRFPAADDTLHVIPPPAGRMHAMCAFTGHVVLALDVPSDEVEARWPAGDLSATVDPGFLTWLGERSGRRPGILDAVLAGIGTGLGADRLPAGGPDLDHPRVRRAVRYRDDVTVYRDTQSAAVVVLGRGLAGRREIAVEVDGEGARGRGVGRAVLAAALGLVPAGEPLFAQVAPGNARSLRAFLAAGYRPIGAEILFSPRPARSPRS